MTNEDLSEEIKLLRRQLEELQRERETREQQTTEETAHLDSAQPDAEAVAVSELDGDLGRELTTQFRELLDSIDKDIKDAKPTTLLIVFALGVLVGRL